MIESNLTAESRMSAVKCMESLREKIEMFMRAGDIIDQFGHVTDKGEIVINGGKIAAHGGLRELWGEGNQSQKIQLFGSG